MNLKGRVALVTRAAGNGMGRSIALTLAREGAAVAINFRTSEPMANAVADHIRTNGGRAVAVRANVSESEACRQMVEETSAQLGPVDIRVVNPGAGWHMGGSSEIDAGDAMADIQNEVAPLYHLMPLVLPGMYQRG